MADAEVSPTYLHVTADDAKSFVEGVLVGYGVLPENAKIVADCLVQADLRGVDTHVSGGSSMILR